MSRLLVIDRSFEAKNMAFEMSSTREVSRLLETDFESIRNKKATEWILQSASLSNAPFLPQGKFPLHMQGVAFTCTVTNQKLHKKQMSEIEKISSLQNPRVKNLVKLRDRRPRDQQGVFIAEGYRALSRALEKEVAPKELYFCPDFFLGKNERPLIEAAEAAGAQLFELSRHAFEKVAYRDRPEGLLAVVKQWQCPLEGLALSSPPFLLVVEAIEKPGNLGTILRSADAAGVDAVICCDSVTDLFNPNLVRSSTGVLFSMPTASVSTDEAIRWIQEKGIPAIAASPHATLLYTDAPLAGPLAVVMGSEQFGLSQKWLEACDRAVRIPMAGQADSLNVAMATLITLFEAVRQRQE